MDLTKLSAARLQAEHDKRDAAHKLNLDATIAAGYGLIRHNDIARMAQDGDAISAAYIAAFERLHEVFREMEARKRWHGSLKPIKPRT